MVSTLFRHVLIPLARNISMRLQTVLMNFLILSHLTFYFCVDSVITIEMAITYCNKKPYVTEELGSYQQKKRIFYTCEPL